MRKGGEKPLIGGWPEEKATRLNASRRSRVARTWQLAAGQLALLNAGSVADRDRRRRVEVCLPWPAGALFRIGDQLVVNVQASLKRGRRFKLVAVGRCEPPVEGRDAGVIPHVGIIQDLNRVLELMTKCGHRFELRAPQVELHAQQPVRPRPIPPCAPDMPARRRHTERRARRRAHR